MLLEFLRDHRDEVIARTKRRVAERTAPRADRTELEKGIPLFLTQLTEIFRLETLGVRKAPDTVGEDAAIHGAELLRNGLTVVQAIHDYGNICQVVTELAAEMNAPITVQEYSTFNRCLDEAMAGAVSEYLRRRERLISEKEIERLGVLAHEQRNLLSAAMLTFQILRDGNMGMNGRTGAVLGRSLMGLRNLTDRALAEVRFATGIHHPARVELAGFIEEIEAVATMEARAKGLLLTVVPAQYGATVEADRQLLGSAVGNLLSNAFKFTRSGGHVVLRTIVGAAGVSIEIEDECGGLPPSMAEELFRPFEQRGTDRIGLGFGLAISRQAVAADGGSIRLRNLPGKGCVFTIDMPGRPVRMRGVIDDITEEKDGAAPVVPPAPATGPREEREQSFSTRQVAQILGHAQGTVKRLADAGALHCLRSSTRGVRRFAPEQVVRYLRGNAPPGTLAESVKAGDVKASLAGIIEKLTGGDRLEEVLDRDVVPMLGSAGTPFAVGLLARVPAIAAEGRRCPGPALVAALGEPEEHEVQLVACVLRSFGYEVLRPTAGTRGSELTMLAERVLAQFAVLVAGAKASDPETIAAAADIASRKRGGTVCIATPRAVGAPQSVAVVHSMRELGLLLRGE